MWVCWHCCCVQNNVGLNSEPQNLSVVRGQCAEITFFASVETILSTKKQQRTFLWRKNGTKIHLSIWHFGGNSIVNFCPNWYFGMSLVIEHIFVVVIEHILLLWSGEPGVSSLHSFNSCQKKAVLGCCTVAKTSACCVLHSFTGVMLACFYIFVAQLISVQNGICIHPLVLLSLHIFSFKLSLKFWHLLILNCMKQQSHLLCLFSSAVQECPSDWSSIWSIAYGPCSKSVEAVYKSENTQETCQWVHVCRSDADIVYTSQCWSSSTDPLYPHIWY